MSNEDAFTLLSLEPRFDLSAPTLDKAYLVFQKKFHPDVFARQSEMMRVAAARQASLGNQAYQHLKTPLTRAELLLKRQGLWPVPSTPETLEEAMALREEKRESDDHVFFEQKIAACREESLKRLTQAFEEKAWPLVLQEYLRLSYLQKL